MYGGATRNKLAGLIMPHDIVALNLKSNIPRRIDVRGTIQPVIRRRHAYCQYKQYLICYGGMNVHHELIDDFVIFDLETHEYLDI